MPTSLPGRKAVVAGWPYCTALLIPLACLGYLLSAPHSAYESLLWLVPMAVPVTADYFGLRVRRAGGMPGSGGWLGWLPLLLAGLFVIDTVLLLAASRGWRLDSPQGLADTLAALVVVKFLFGSNAAVSGLVTAHELIHRPSPFLRGAGRVLLILCGYEHFATEHVRGHHRRVGREEDPATARLGETYAQFWRRTVPAQFVSAWRLESRRLHLRTPWERGWLQHRVLHGVVAEAVLLVAIGVWGGFLPLLAFSLQALMGVRNLEAINYVQHWGLCRPGGPPGPQHAWRTDAWCSTYLLLGLARHADHHRCPALPYYRLEDLPTAPTLPWGYFALMFIVTYANRSFQKIAVAELRRLGLSPCATRAWDSGRTSGPP